MQRILVNMHNVLLGQIVEQSLKSSGEFYTMTASRPEEVQEKCSLFRPDILLMEILGSSPWSLENRLEIRRCLQQQNSPCKVVLLVDENTDGEIAERVKQAKRSGLIDQFVYGSSSASFLVALMETL